MHGPAESHDPLEGFNRAMYSFNDGLDRAIIKPVAKTYQKVVPKPVNKGISNFFSNLGDVIVILNDLLQFKLIQAASDTGRVVLNSTVGLLGFIDVATPIGLEKHNEDFGQSLGYWGIGPGYYLVLPLFGPSNLRDGVGLAVDFRADPITTIEDDSARYGVFSLKAVDKRAGLLKASRILDEAAFDPYIFVRDAYLQRRNYLVYDGSPPLPEYEEDDYFEDDFPAEESDEL